MLSGNKNPKDSLIDHNLSIKDISFSISYTKTHKLITALYMVTDIIDREEPIRNKLRTLGADIVSDMHSIPAGACNKIAETVSFLNIASAMNFISEMNCAILKKELLELRGSIQEYINMKPTWLADFMLNSELPFLDKEGLRGGNSKITTSPFGRSSSVRRKENSIGHQFTNGQQTRIGVQKGSTLMKALSDRLNPDVGRPTGAQAFDILKRQRRDKIITIIKNNEGNATIKDIRTKINVGVEALFTCSEKTLQRELLSMTREGVLKKTGEKRWTRYRLVNLINPAN